MTTHAPTAATTANPLTPDQHRQIVAANERARKIRRAATVALFNGWTLGACAVISSLFAFCSLTGVIVAVALWFIVYFEFRGRRQLLKFDPKACRLLGWNQVALMTLLVGYCAWSIYWLYQNPELKLDYPGPPISREDWDSTKELLKELNKFIRPALFATYITVIVVAVLVQGGNALYYFTRERLVRSFLAETEPWVIDVQKSAAAK